ncbi:FemAB family XrtA/PEP-CTERM system-associated protein [Novosphingopyxis sp.]|uniref:FemAB family XrtA/PEP-CTERM system-associated protein n=1 Tax=Novosphingopyxis sp. TaxID=2709690 RepID=UPI003B5A53BD
MSAPFADHTPCLHHVSLDDAGAMADVQAFLAKREDSTPFHRPAWLKAVRQGCGQKGYYLVARRVAGICGLLPLTEIRSPLFGKALVSTGFAVDGGIIADDHATRRLLTDHAISDAREQGFPTFELRGGTQPSGEGWSVDDTTYCGFTRPIEADEDAQLKAVPRKQRAEIRKALGGDLTVETGSGQRDRDWHYAVYSQSVRNLGTPVFPKKLFAAMLDGFGEDADILTVLHEGKPVASVLSFYHQGTVLPYWGGGLHTARGLRANELMYFALMTHARSRGCATFDFGRSKTGTGPYSYKKNWGFEPQPLRYASWSADGQARDVNPNSPKYRMMVDLWRKLPLPVANLIGPWIAKGLG